MVLGEDGNCGTCYLSDEKGYRAVIPIDSLPLSSCDLIQLDIEGYELEALKGAKETIEKFNPVIVVELKELPHAPRKHKQCARYLNSLGYKEVGKVHRDVIFKRVRDDV